MVDTLETKNKPTVRSSSVELLRIVIMLMIVCCHFASHGGFAFDSKAVTIPRLWWGFIEFGGNFGVNVFVFISGYFLITSKNLSFNLKRILKFWGQIFFYSLIIFGFSLATGKASLNISGIVKAFFPITFSLWWFASTYFVLYLLHPFINKALHCLTKQQYQTLLVLFFIIWCIIPTFTRSTYQSNSLWEFVMFYAIAGYIRLYGFNPKLKVSHYFIGFAIFFLLTYASYVVAIIAGTKITALSGLALHFYGRTKILTLFSSICFFAAFVNMKPFYNKYINIISSAAFGVYLLHDHPFMREYLWKDVFKNASFQNTILIIPYSILVTLIIYVIASVIDLIRQYTIERIYMNAVNKYADKISGKFSIFKKIQTFILGEEEEI